MPDSLPDAVIVTELPDGVHYRLPLRKRGGFVWMGFAHLTAGAIGIPFMLFWLYGLLAPAFAQPQPLDGPGSSVVFFALAGLFMLGMIVWATSQGISRLIGHCEIEIRGDSLRGFECWGPIRFGWRRSVAELQRFEVRHADLDAHAIKAYDTTAAAVDYHVILPVWDSDAALPVEKRKRLAWGYPRDWLLPLADELARRVQLATTEPSATMTPVAPPVPVRAEPLPNDAGFIEEIEQPAGSPFVVEQSNDMLRASIPGTMELVVDGGVLRVEQRKMFRRRVHVWSHRQLAEIRVGRIVDSDGPDTPLLLIRPHPGEGDLLRLPVKEEADARWLATLLRQHLHLENVDWQRPGGPFLERDERPPLSTIELERTPEGVSLRVARGGILHPAVRGHYLSALFLMVLAAALGTALALIPNNRLFLLVGQPWLEWIFAALCFLVVVFLVHAVYVSTRRVRLDVVGDILRVQRKTLLGTTRTQWLRASIADVRVGYHLSRMVPMSIRQTLYDSGSLPWELHIHLENGDAEGVLESYPAAELQWVATVLRRELELPKASSDAD